MNTFIIVNETAYEIDTNYGRNVAQDALCAAGLTESPVWVGDVEDPDAYTNGQVFYVQDAP